MRLIFLHFNLISDDKFKSYAITMAERPFLLNFLGWVGLVLVMAFNKAVMAKKRLSTGTFIFHRGSSPPKRY